MTQSLTERIRAKTEQDRSEMQKMTEAVLKEHAENVADIVNNERTIIEQGIKDLTKPLISQRRSIWITTACCLTIIVVSLISALGLNLYLGQELLDRQRDLSALRATLQEIEGLRGVGVTQTESGSTILSFPNGTEMLSCNPGDIPCIELGR